MDTQIPDSERLILDYLDGNLSDDQAREFRKAVEASKALQIRLEELRAVHEALTHGQPLMSPSQSFTQRVMNRLDTTLAGSSISPRNGLLLLCGLLVATGLVVVMLGWGAFDGWIGNLPVRPLGLPALEEYRLPSIPFNGKTLMKIIIIINTGLGFVLLDRTVLRPYFSNRARQVGRRSGAVSL